MNTPNIKNKKLSFKKHGLDFEAHPIEERRTVHVTCDYWFDTLETKYGLIDIPQNIYELFRSEGGVTVKCHPDDKFNPVKGSRIGAQRLLKRLTQLMSNYNLSQNKKLTSIMKDLFEPHDSEQS
jgi:hypothetical protein